MGITLFIVGAINYHKARVLSFSYIPPQVINVSKISDSPVEVIIPSIHIGIKVDPANIKDGVWEISRENATHLATSSIPGQMGNTVIYGHNLKRIFGNLPYVSIGQKVMVKTASGKIHNYVIKEKYFVKPDRVDLVSPTDEEELTLYTCWGLFDRERAVIKAKPI